MELRNTNKLIFESSKDPDDENLKKFLGMPVFDDVYERKHKKPHPGSLKICILKFCRLCKCFDGFWICWACDDCGMRLRFIKH